MTYTKGVPIYGLAQGSVTIFAEPQGSRRFPSMSVLDFRFEKSFYYKEKRISLMLDVFNLFNRGVVTNVWAKQRGEFR